jgi:hypothetical protein
MIVNKSLLKYFDKYFNLRKVAFLLGELEKISGETKGLRDIKAVNGEALDP